MGVSWWLPFYVSQRGLKTRWAGYFRMALFVERPVEWFGDVPFVLFCLLASIIFAGFLSVLLSTLLSVLRMRGMSLLASQASILNDCKKVLNPGQT